MPKLGDLVLDIVVDGKKGVATIKNFGETVDKTVVRAEKKFTGLNSSFSRIANAGQRVFFAFQGLRLLTAPIGNLIRLSNAQERADQKLASALRAVNQFSTENLKLLKRQATDIQAVTIVGDEQAQVLQSLAINMGVSIDKVDQATRGAIGLTAQFKDAGLSQELALKGIALAYNGNFTQLQRYIPALRSLKTPTEKITLLQSLMAKGFEQAKDEAKTSAGQMEQFGNLVGDLKEKLGDTIKEALIPILSKLKTLVVFLNNVSPAARKLVLGITSVIVILRILSTIIAGFGVSIGPVGWLLTGIGLLAGLMLTLRDNSDKAKIALANFANEIKVLNLQQAQQKLADLSAEISKVELKLKKAKPRSMNFAEALIHAPLAPVVNTAAQKKAFSKQREEIDLLNKKKAILLKRIKELKTARQAETASIKEQVDVEKQAADTEKQLQQAREEAERKRLQNLRDLKELRIANIRDEFARRRAVVEDWFEQQKTAHAGQNEFLIELEKQKAIRLERIAKDQADMQKKTVKDTTRSIAATQRLQLDVLGAGYDEFFTSLTDLELTGEARREQIFQAMQNQFLNAIGNMLKGFIVSKGKELFVHKATEKAKTGATKTQTAARLGTSLSAIGKEIAAVIRSIGAWIGQIAAKLFAFFASLGPFGLLAGIGAVVGAVKLVKGIIRGVMSFAKGGEVLKPTIALAGDAGPEIFAPKRDFVQVVNNLIQNRDIRTAAGEAGGQAVVNRLDKLEKSIRAMKFVANIDETGIALAVEAGNQSLSESEF